MATPANHDPLLFNSILIIHGYNDGVTKEGLEEHFGQYGRIKHVNIKPKPDKSKTYTYVKFEKTSEACRAVEESRGQKVPGTSRSTVLLADFKREYLEMDVEFQEVLHTLFVVHPKDKPKEQILQHFREYGDIESANMLTDRQTGRPKGVIFLRFVKQSDAAVALEEISHPYKGKWAHVRPIPTNKIDDMRMQMHQDNMASVGGARGPKLGSLMGNGRRVASLLDPEPLVPGFGGVGRQQGFMGGGGGMPMDVGNFGGGFGGGAGGMGGGGPMGGAGYGALDNFRGGAGGGGGMGDMGGRNGGDLGGFGAAPLLDRPIPEAPLDRKEGEENTLEVLVPQTMSLDTLRKIFDICPGLLAFDVPPGSRMAKVVYKSASLAAHAKEKVDGLDWSGEFIAVRFPPEPAGKNVKEKLQETLMKLKSGNAMANLSTIVSSLEEAITVAVDKPLQPMGMNAPSRNKGDLETLSWSSVPLPFSKPMSPPDTEPKAEVFFRASQGSLLFPDDVLIGILSRFGGLIHAFWVKSADKREAFARFSNVASAEDCLRTLNGASVHKVILKGMWSKNSKYQGSGKRSGEQNQHTQSKKSRFN